MELHYLKSLEKACQALSTAPRTQEEYFGALIFPFSSARCQEAWALIDHLLEDLRQLSKSEPAPDHVFHVGAHFLRSSK
jgi:hypothetical protein